MLFLAVFCGFLAEYQLEHVIEHQREKEYAASLLQDLRKDSLDLVSDINYWKPQIARIDTIHEELGKPEPQRESLTLYKQAGFMRTYNSFEYHDRTINQLKNAGYFRLVRKKKVADSLMDYDAVVTKTLLNIEGSSTNIYSNLNNLQNKLFDTRYFFNQEYRFNLDSLYRVRPEVFKIRDDNKDLLFEYANHLLYYRGNIFLRLRITQRLLAKAKSLIEQLKKEYRLKY